ncbi:MAG: molybdopterin synthase sulfur carrier subunit [Candidatus Krumholzibacteriia bacterium]
MPDTVLEYRVSNVTIRYFAALREQAQLSGEERELTVKTAGELFAQLSTEHDFSLTADQIKVAVNQEYREMDHELVGGDEVVFIPPVSGG